MTSASWSNVDQQVIERLRIRAQRNGRSLDAEINAILEAVAAAESLDQETLPQTQHLQSQERLRQAQAKYYSSLGEDWSEIASTQELQPWRSASTPLSPSEVISTFRQLRQASQPDNTSIRDLINEGRRF
jgi:plasmid stability protein